MPGRRLTEKALEVLVDAARRGDPGAPEQLVQATWQSTYTLAYRLTGNEQDALDVTQEAYLRAFRGLPRFRGEARFSTWLYRVTANCASNLMANKRRSSHVRLDPEGESFAGIADWRPEHDPEAAASACDERALLAEALMRLPWRLRQVVVLRDVYDLPHRSIAAQVGISEAAAKVRLQRARKRLRDDLSSHLQDAGVPRRTKVGPKRGGRGRGHDGTSLALPPVVFDEDAVAS